MTSSNINLRLSHTLILLTGLLLALFIGSCDNQITQPQETKPKNTALPERGFFSQAEATHPMLRAAMDTLRKRNEMHKFTDAFIQTRGYPVWNEASTFPQQGQIVMLVPVIRPEKQSVTGIMYIGVNVSQPVFRWVPRGAEIDGDAGPDSQTLENIMLMFEQDVFGRVQKPNIQIQTERKTAADLDSSSTFRASKVTPVVIEYDCGRVSAGGGSWGDWDCETKIIWIDVGGGGGSPGGGSGGGSSGGTSDPGDGDNPDDPDCISMSTLAWAVPSIKAPAPGDDGDPNDPPLVEPCENNGQEESDESDYYTITNYPEVKYPVDSDYPEKYPKFTEYLKNQLPTLKDNTTIIDALEKYGDLTSAEIKEQLEWGKGPTIEIVQLDQYPNCNASCLGQYSSENPNSLLIDVDLVNDLEDTTVGSEIADAFSFLVGVTVLHELVHFSEYADEAWNSPESGELFEEDVYGHTVWRSNAKIILRKNQ